jgi:hypothetical protein
LGGLSGADHAVNRRAGQGEPIFDVLSKSRVSGAIEAFGTQLAQGEANLKELPDATFNDCFEPLF